MGPSRHYEIGSFISNRYRVLSVLGVGGQGAVYKVADTQDNNKTAAVKVVFWNLNEDGENALQRVTAEYSVLCKLLHPNIVAVYDAGRLDKTSCYIAMEYLAGQTLGSRIEQMDAAPLPFEEVLRTLHAVALGLECVHDAKVLHRDLKPANILLTENGGVKILDFGLARDLELGHTITKTGETIGTPDYMSPEQLTRKFELDQRTDIYSLGMIAFQMVNGKPPFTSNVYHEVATAHLLKPIPELTNAHYDVPRWFHTFVVVCAEKKRDDRYQSMREVREFLERRMASLGLIEKASNPEPRWLKFFSSTALGT